MIPRLMLENYCSFYHCVMRGALDSEINPRFSSQPYHWVKVSGLPYCMNSCPTCLLRWLLGKGDPWTQFVGCDPSYRKSFFLNKTRIFNNFPYKTGCYIWIAVLHQSCCRAPETKTHVDWSIYSGFARQLTNLGIFFVHLFDFLVSERWRKVEYNEIDEGCGNSIL